MVDALRRIHRSLVPGGALLDMRPGLADSAVLTGGADVGCLDESAFRSESERVDAALLASVHEGFFTFEDEIHFDVVHSFESAAELLEDVSGWRSTRVPPEVAELVERGGPPFEVRERCSLKRLRPL